MRTDWNCDVYPIGIVPATSDAAISFAFFNRTRSHRDRTSRSNSGSDVGQVKLRLNNRRQIAAVHTVVLSQGGNRTEQLLSVTLQRLFLRKR
jgi:hypothetical protein